MRHTISTRYSTHLFFKCLQSLTIPSFSFFDGGRFDNPINALKQVEQMLKEGADIIDVGGMSSRPGAPILNPVEEQARIIPVIKEIRRQFPETVISVDTIYSNTVRVVFDLGADIINDISAGSLDNQMFATVAKLQIPYILMHMQGKPMDMQNAPAYDDPVQEILDFFIEKVGQLKALGCKDLIIDPGFGFGKSLAHNYQILKKMHVFSILGLPILAGVSRKSMIYKLLGTSATEALNGTSVLNYEALCQGSKILRVHDVKAAKEVLQLWQQMEGL